MPTFSDHRPRALALVGLLVLTLGLVGALAYQALDAARSHRATAEATLRDYAAFAGWEFSRQSDQVLHTPLHVTVDMASEGGPGAPLPDGVEVERKRAGWKEGDCPLPDSVRYFFRYHLGTGELETSEPALSVAARAWLADTIGAQVRALEGRSWELATLVGNLAGRPRFVVFGRPRGRPWRQQESREWVYGFEASPAVLAPIFEGVFEKGVFLPPALTRGAPADSLLAFTITDPTGQEIYRSAAGAALAFASEDGIGAEPDGYGGLVVRTALRPAAAGQLVIGGLPRTRLPILLGLLVLTAALLIALLFQLRREQELTRLRAGFVSGVSHELRTPLAQIRMFGETLALGRTRSELERRRAVEIIVQEAQRLGHLVENVLHFSRAERRAARIAPQESELAPLARQVVERFAPLARSRRAALRTELEGGIVASVDTDALCQMLLNLLDNAAKYGPPGQTITVGVEYRDGRARLRVDDEGLGVPPRDRERVFEAFERLARDAESASGGSGIGLSVVRELAGLHGGQAWIEDAPGGGARFVVELPAVRAGSPTEPTVAEAAPVRVSA